MTLTDVRSDVALLFASLLDLGDDQTIGNQQLRHSLGWAQRGRFERARDTLVAAGVIHILPGGHGGRLCLVDGTATALPEWDRLAVSTERGLYPHLIGPLHELLREGDPDTEDDDLQDADVAIAVVGDRGRANTGGRYSRPDLVAALRRRFTAFDALEVHGFEVKAYWSADRVSVYEAVAQRALSLATHSWVVLYLPDERVHLRAAQRSVVERAQDRLPKIQHEAADLGVGLVVFKDLQLDGMDVLGRPARSGADPERLDEFLRSAAPDLLSRIGVVPRTALA